MAKPVRYEVAHEDVLREGRLDQAIYLFLLQSQGVRVAMLRYPDNWAFSPQAHSPRSKTTLTAASSKLQT